MPPLVVVPILIALIAWCIGLLSYFVGQFFEVESFILVSKFCKLTIVLCFLAEIAVVVSTC